MGSGELTNATAGGLAGLIAAREVSAREVIEAHLRRIEEVNGAINAVVQVDGERAAIIAAQGSPCGLGTDSGASVRLPAHFCGLASIKPSAGRVPLTGVLDDEGELGTLGDPRTPSPSATTSSCARCSRARRACTAP